MNVSTPRGLHFVHINGKVNHNGSQVPLTLYIRDDGKSSAVILEWSMGSCRLLHSSTRALDIDLHMEH